MFLVMKLETYLSDIVFIIVASGYYPREDKY